MQRVWLCALLLGSEKAVLYASGRMQRLVGSSWNANVKRAVVMALDHDEELTTGAPSACTLRSFEFVTQVAA